MKPVKKNTTKTAKKSTAKKVAKKSLLKRNPMPRSTALIVKNGYTDFADVERHFLKSETALKQQFKKLLNAKDDAGMVAFLKKH